jgi:PAS domain-containing protein
MGLDPQVGNLLSSLHVAAYVVDDAGSVVYLNPAATELTGWHLSEVVGRKGNEIFGGSVGCPCDVCNGFSIHPPDLMCKSAEGTIRTRSGENHPVRVGVSELPGPAGTGHKVVVIEDLERTCPTAAPLATQPFQKPMPAVQTDWGILIESLFDAIPDGISVLDPDLTIRRVNRTMTEWYKDRMPLVGRRCYDCYQNRIGPCFRCPSLRCLESGKVEREIVEGPANSAVRRIELISFPLKDAHTGKAFQVVEYVRNITASADLEQCHHRFVAASDQFRELFRDLKAGPAALQGAAPSPASTAWRTHVDSIATRCLQILDNWTDLAD